MIMNKAYFYGWHLRSCSLEVKELIVTTGQEPQLNLAHPIFLTMADQLIEHTILNLILIGFITRSMVLLEGILINLSLGLCFLIP